MTKSADAFRTISEVAEWLGVQTHVLRFWESKFSQVKPVKRAGGRRYYRPNDMLLLGGIRKLLHEDGMTIKGVQKILREEGMAHVADLSRPLDEVTAGQVDGDLVSGDGNVEADIAPSIEAVQEAAEVTPIHAPTQPSQAAEPSPAPSFLSDLPAPGATPQEDTPQAVAADEPEQAPEVPPLAPAPEPESESDPMTTLNAEPEASPAPVPSFMRRDVEENASPESAKPAPEEPAAADEPIATDAAPADDPAPKDDIANETPAAAPLPSFMTERSEPQEAEMAAAEPLQEDTAPRPANVDVPADPDYASFDAAPSALTHAARLSHINDGQREMLRPLLAQLTALRDQMASARRDSR